MSPFCEICIIRNIPTQLYFSIFSFFQKKAYPYVRDFWLSFYYLGLHLYFIMYFLIFLQINIFFYLFCHIFVTIITYNKHKVICNNFFNYCVSQQYN
nr:MAG TPA: hypothetical protein [Caudoviricetes sp.]